MRAEQAADFLNSYVRGRLYAAKERMLMQGMWMGGNINLGYMVDDRKSLPSGIPNQNWRKYQPFEPCAEVVVKIFEMFVMLGGNQRGTLLRIFARLLKNEYSVSKSNGHIRRQVEEREQEA